MNQSGSGYARPEGRTWHETGKDPLALFPGLLDCVHCGFCLDVCPTYKVTGEETESPRGRIALLRAAAEGRLAEEDIAGPIARCVLCRACEPACPSNVPYHRLVERHREGRVPAGLRILLHQVLPSRPALRAVGLLLRGLRAIGILGLSERLGPRRLRALAGAVPEAPARFVPRPGTEYPARGEARGRVALHLGCVNAEFFGPVLQATVQLLRAQGFEVVVPAQPACCGSLHLHSGDADFGRDLADRTARAFSDCDAVIVPAAGCSAHLAEHDPRAGFEDPLVFLDRIGLRAGFRPMDLRVCYDPPCHLHNVLQQSQATRRVLEAVPGLRLVPHVEAELCCGAGGISFAREPEISEAVLERKLDRLELALPDYVLSGNPGCLLRFESGLRRRQSGLRALHPVELLARASR